jgi:hypothetical protein
MTKIRLVAAFRFFAYSDMRRLWAVAALVLTLTAVQAHGSLLGFFRGGSSSYSDLCSQTGISCVYAWSVVHRLNSASTDPFQLTRLSDNAVFEASYTGSNYIVNVAAATTFCLGHGGTTTSTSTYTTYNDCSWTELYDQVSTCHLKPNTTKQWFPFRIWSADGYPALIDPVQAGNGANSSTVPWLTATGCSAVAGGVAKSLIVRTNSTYPSNCCGQIGLNENASYPATIADGSMWSWLLYTPGLYVGADYEGASVSGIISSSPVDGVGIATFDGTAATGGTNLGNSFWNNVQVGTNITPSHAINTQSRVSIGCDGDQGFCGPVFMRDAIITSNDVSATTGLPAAIYNYLTNLYAAL